MLSQRYFDALGELAILELFEFLKGSMELRRMNSNVEEFNLSNVAMLMNLAMQFGIDIQNFNNEMK